MGIKRFKPTSPGRRFMTVDTFEEITRSSLPFEAIRWLKRKTFRPIRSGVIFAWFKERAPVCPKCALREARDAAK